jgi:filamentous hemagglutinin
VGTGTTADAVRNELDTGQPTGGLFHSQKATEYSNALNKLLKTGNLDAHDQIVARSLVQDLKNSLQGKP